MSQIGRPYDLRHSFASLLIHEGRSLADAAAPIGDAVATAADTYTHALSKQRRCRVSRRKMRSRRLVYVTWTSGS